MELAGLLRIISVDGDHREGRSQTIEVKRRCTCAVEWGWVDGGLV